ncbi:MAG: HlyD family efflux transporter periplasmic adaptor subunit [Desulfomonilaceae bacterium]|nr:HlyD family efflux transporter periplasmic adaptor subunit [Desulfomonilaceae bacterium]
MEANPKFRVDLEIYRYDDIEDRDTVVLKDPVSAKYYYLSVYEYRLLKTLDGNLTLEEAVDKLSASAYYYTMEDAATIVGKAAQMGLVMGTRFGTADYQERVKRHMETAKKARRFAGIYFLFVPLLNPDKFLERTLWIAKLIANRLTIGALAIALPGAIYCIVSGFDRIQNEYLYFFNLQNLVYLWITIAFTKLIHEFGHAYTAKSYGLHVPEMGVAFLIFFPCLYCNTTDAWQLAARKQRIAISGAGILVEGALAIISTYIWYFSGPGMVNSLAFYLMAVSFISTVLFNGNPLMRFDGYFILMDWLKLPNLYTRSFGYVKYLFMNRVLGMSSVPSTAGTQRETAIFTTYGIAAFCYRIFLYLAIAAGVYYRFDKTLGILLAVTAIVLFIVRPVLKGLKTIVAERRELHPRLAGTLVLGTLAALLVVVSVTPISGRSVYSCYLASARSQKLTVPLQTLVKEVYVRAGASVSKGDLLFTLDTSALRLRLQETENRREILQTELKYLLVDETKMAEAAGKEIELRKVEDEAGRIKRDLDLAERGIVAPFDGVVTHLDHRLQSGFQPGEGIVVGELASTTDALVHALIPARDIRRVEKDMPASVWFKVGTGLTVKGTIKAVNQYTEQDLTDLPFSSRLGGEFATEAVGQDRTDAPLEALYQCSINLQNPDSRIPLGMTGKLVLESPPRSFLERGMEVVFTTFNRESLF